MTLAAGAPALKSDRGRLLAGIAFVLGFCTIAGAWGSQLIGGLTPCELCLDQRMAYYWGLPVLVLILILWNRLPRLVWLMAMVIAIAIFVWSFYMAGYHAGVEKGFWPGPTACTGLGVSVDFSDLKNINAAKVIPCDKIQWEMFGLTLAGANTLLSLVVVGLLGAATAIGRKR